MNRSHWWLWRDTWCGSWIRNQMLLWNTKNRLLRMTRERHINLQVNSATGDQKQLMHAWLIIVKARAERKCNSCLFKSECYNNSIRYKPALMETINAIEQSTLTRIFDSDNQPVLWLCRHPMSWLKTSNLSALLPIFLVFLLLIVKPVAVWEEWQHFMILMLEMYDS